MNNEQKKLRTRYKLKKSNKKLFPRIVISRTNKNIYAQLICSKSGNVILQYSTRSESFSQEMSSKKLSGMVKAQLIGKEFVKLCMEKGIKKAIFDRGAYCYIGRVKLFAESCRDGGLEF